MTLKKIDRKVSIAPMMDHTDSHFRYFMRLLSRHVMLYTEMITTGALIHGDRQRFLAFNAVEHPLAIQIGGSNPSELTECARIAEDAGYDEINLNIGCPSDRVQNGQFGACLMGEPALVADCVSSMCARISIPVTVKTRIGIDDHDAYEFLHNFVSTISQAGCQTFIIHARKAILSGLSPKENREIPPLHYDRVYRVKQDFPSIEIIINGGITDIRQVKDHLNRVDGVMIGRLAYQDPYSLAEIDKHIFNENSEPASRQQILERYYEYVNKKKSEGIRPKNLTRHIIGLFQGQPGAKHYRRLLSDTKSLDRFDINYFREAIDLVTRR